LCALGLVVALVFALQKRVGTISIGALIRTIGMSCLATLGMAAPLYIATQSWWPASRGLQIGYFLGLCLVGSWIYYFATRAMKMPETNYLDRVFKRGKLSR
jgi:peptidoglycan biosynthesis protein MviN/MurJ (putative lipid II flippase)